MNDEQSLATNQKQTTTKKHKMNTYNETLTYKSKEISNGRHQKEFKHIVATQNQTEFSHITERQWTMNNVQCTITGNEPNLGHHNKHKMNEYNQTFMLQELKNQQEQWQTSKRILSQRWTMNNHDHYKKVSNEYMQRNTER